MEPVKEVRPDGGDQSLSPSGIECMLCALGFVCLPLPATLSPRRPGAEQPRTQTPKVTWLFLGLDLCQQ